MPTRLVHARSSGHRALRVRLRIAVCASLSIVFAAACGIADNTPAISAPAAGAPAAPALLTESAAALPIPADESLFAIPTLDPTRGVPATGTFTSTYTVQRGDTLGGIALNVDMSVADLRTLNGLSNDLVRVGQTLVVRVPVKGNAPSIKLIPDSELVNGPGAVNFDLGEYIGKQRGHLVRYSEEVGDETLSGAQIVQRVSEQMSVHPRLLLAALEYAGGWVSGAQTPSGDQLLYPLGYRKTNLNGLYFQLVWAAARFNEGYYGWRLNNRSVVRLEDGSYAFVGDGINAGTAGVQNWLAAISPPATWRDSMRNNGSRSFTAVYRRMFGDPWDFDYGRLVPAGVKQPSLALPWRKGERWYYTGGPHSAWGRGTPWGALDFTSSSVAGCRRLSEWVTAMADGVITRSTRGEVMQSLDPSGDDRIGWSILYLHIGSDGRIDAGKKVAQGDRIGHPSCEGGISNGAHVHIVRRFNGEWLNSTGLQPFVLGGWQVAEGGQEYDGALTRGRARREACECKEPATNGIEW